MQGNVKKCTGKRLRARGPESRCTSAAIHSTPVAVLQPRRHGSTTARRAQAEHQQKKPDNSVENIPRATLAER